MSVLLKGYHLVLLAVDHLQLTAGWAGDFYQSHHPGPLKALFDGRLSSADWEEDHPPPLQTKPPSPLQTLTWYVSHTMGGETASLKPWNGCGGILRHRFTGTTQNMDGPHHHHHAPCPPCPPVFIAQLHRMLDASVWVTRINLCSMRSWLRKGNMSLFW